jgi:hypothetical protein
MGRSKVTGVDLEVECRLELVGESSHVETVKGLGDLAGFEIRVAGDLFVSMPFWHCLVGSKTCLSFDGEMVQSECVDLSISLMFRRVVNLGEEWVERFAICTSKREMRSREQDSFLLEKYFREMKSHTRVLAEL